MSRPLLDPSSPLYLKRLARELNALGDGFYCTSLRFTAARYRAGDLQGRHLDREGRVSWLRIEPNDVEDAYGRTVSASRAPRS